MTIETAANYKQRNFAKMDPGTRQLVLAIMGKASPKIDNHIVLLAENLKRCDLVEGLAVKVASNQPLILDWVSLMNLIFIDCLRVFHPESYEHMLRVRKIIQEIRNMLEKHNLKDLPDYGILEFNQLKSHFELTVQDWVILEYAACFHDLGKMAFPRAFWDTPGKFNSDQRKALEAHARVFFYLGEFLDLDQIVTGLSVLHHYRNLGYPQNGIVSKVKAQISASGFDRKKFRHMLDLLITVDVYEGISGKRSYRKERYGHEKTLVKMVSELGKIGQSYIPFLQALWEMMLRPKALCFA